MFQKSNELAGDIVRLTEHFTLKELSYSANAQAKGIDNIMPDKLLSNALRIAVVLEKIRSHYNLPLTVLSCYRSPEVNKLVGGTPTSAHIKALACDFRIKGVSNFSICEWIRDNIQDYDQIIYEFGEQGWCHIGLSYGSPRMQCLTAQKVHDEVTQYLKGFVKGE